MNEIHSLLKRQLRRLYGDSPPASKEWREMINVINTAYKEFDEDRSMLERSLELSSQELLQANCEMRAVLQSLPDLFIWTTADGTISNCKGGNPADLFLPFEKLVYKRIQDVPNRKIGVMFQEAIDLINTTKEMVNFEFSLLVQNKNQQYEARLLPLLENKIIAVIRNITARKRAERSLAAEKEHLSVTLRSIHEGVITTDTGGLIILINEMAQRLTGWSEKDAVGKPFEVVFRMSHTHTGWIGKEFLKSYLRTGEFDESENQFELFSAEGTQRIIVANSAPLHGEEDEISGFVLVFRDITDKQKLRAEHQKATKLESLGVLAGGIAHDFNNLLMSIMGNISLLHKYLNHEKEGQLILEEAENASLRAKDLTQQLLTFSKGGAPIKKKSAIIDLVRDSTAFALRGSNVSCKYSFADDLWLAEVDDGQISQVFHNLIINADQAMPAGGVITIDGQCFTVTVTGRDMLTLPEGKYIKISVHDQGVGIMEKHLPNVFDPYYTTKQKGSGLGLSVAYSIIKNHDGLVTVDSKIGVGSTFNIFLPASGEVPLSVAKNEKKEDLMMGSGKVLFMDDEESVRIVVNRMLELLGYTPSLAKDGNEAVMLYKEALDCGQPYDVVVMDLTVPGGMGGEEAVQKILDFDPDVTAIVSSGYANDPIMSDFGQYGFCDIIPKPFKFEEMSRILHKVINN